MFRKQITIALACAGLICASTASDSAKQNTTVKQPVLVARSGQQGGSSTGKSRGGTQGKPGSGKQINPKGDKPVASA
jgi:hypothetical protein